MPLLEAKRWFRDNGDSTCRLKYELTPESIVVDLGGYVGDFAAQIFRLYGSTVHLFEPVPAFYVRCENRFSDISNIQVHPFGLGRVGGFFQITDADDASSFVTATGTPSGIVVEVKPIIESFLTLQLESIDLLKINIEGGEYDVLPVLIETGWIKKIKNIQIQFHTCGKDYKDARNAIRSALGRTHDETWCYEFVWENWTKRT